MRGAFNIRSNPHTKTSELLRADRNPLQREAFSITRELTDESAKRLGMSIVGAFQEISNYLGARPSQPASVTLQKGMHTTYLAHSDTLRALKKGDINLFQTKTLRDKLKSVARSDTTIPIPIKDIEWIGQKNNKLAIVVTDPATERLFERQTAEIGSVFEEHEAYVDLSPPSHITALRYRGPNSANFVADRHRNFVKHAVIEALQASDITHLQLGIRMVETESEAMERIA